MEGPRRRRRRWRRRRVIYGRKVVGPLGGSNERRADELRVVRFKWRRPVDGQKRTCILFAHLGAFEWGPAGAEWNCQQVGQAQTCQQPAGSSSASSSGRRKWRKRSPGARLGERLPADRCGRHSNEPIDCVAAPSESLPPPPLIAPMGPADHSTQSGRAGSGHAAGLGKGPRGGSLRWGDRPGRGANKSRQVFVWAGRMHICGAGPH